MYTNDLPKVVIVQINGNYVIKQLLREAYLSFTDASLAHKTWVVDPKDAYQAPSVALATSVAKQARLNSVTAVKVQPVEDFFVLIDVTTKLYIRYISLRDIGKTDTLEDALRYKAEDEIVRKADQFAEANVFILPDFNK